MRYERVLQREELLKLRKITVLCCPLAESFLRLETQRASPGDTGAIISPYHNFTATTAVTFRAQVDAEYYDTVAQLEVKLVQRYPYKEVRLLTVNALPQIPNSNGTGRSEWSTRLENEVRRIWRGHTVCVPSGEYAIMFLATYGESSSPSVSLDDVSLSGACEETIEGKVTSLPMVSFVFGRWVWVTIVL